MNFNGNLLIASMLSFLFRSDASTTDNQIDEIFKNSGSKDLYTTHSEITRPIHVPVFQKVPVPVPHPEPFAVPHYVKVPIPQPYPKYITVKHPVKIPVYKVVPEVIEKPVHYIVEKPYPIEVEKPFPVETIKKLEIPIPKPYPVHVTVYKHVVDKENPGQLPVQKGKPVVGFGYNGGAHIPTKGIYDTKTHSFIESEFPQKLSHDNIDEFSHRTLPMDPKPRFTRFAYMGY